ncbi:MAG: hypothetical protein GXP27_06345 [Planctomycetes bacterium]|nr:hypothetical protein [Planctomycetota bacterium]
MAAVTQDPVLLPYQQRFVRKIVDEVIGGGFDHVLFQIDNESGIGDETLEPDPYWARFIRSHARKRRPDCEVYVCTSRRFHWPAPKLTKHFRDWSNPEIRVPILNTAFNYCDISQNNGNSGQQHYDDLLWYRAKVLAHGARPINNIKCYHFNWPIGARFRERIAGTDAEATAKFWRVVFAGAASIRFHRSTRSRPGAPRDGLGLSPTAQRHLHSMNEFLGAVNIFRMEPRNDLLSERSANEAYCMAEPGRQYAIFFTGEADRAVRIKLPASEHTFQLKWLDIARTSWTKAIPLSAEPRPRITAPGLGQYVAVLSYR